MHLPRHFRSRLLIKIQQKHHNSKVEQNFHLCPTTTKLITIKLKINALSIKKTYWQHTKLKFYIIRMAGLKLHHP